MTWAYWVVGIVTGLLMVYLFAAMLKPEKF